MGRQVEIVELADLEKHYVLLHARLELLQALPDTTAHLIGAAPTPHQAVAMLVNAAMYDSAINVATVFQLPLDVVFDALATRYRNYSINYMILCACIYDISQICTNLCAQRIRN